MKQSLSDKNVELPRASLQDCGNAFLWVGAVFAAACLIRPYFPKIAGASIHQYAWFVLLLAILNVADAIPLYVWSGIKTITDVFTKNWSGVVFAGIGIALTDFEDFVSVINMDTLVISLAVVIGAVVGTALVGALLGLYPQVDVELCCVKSGKLVQMMELGQVHAAFVRGQFETGMECVEISREQGCILSRDPVALEDLPGLDRIIYDISGPSQSLIDQWWKQQYETEPKITLNAAFIDNAWNMAKQRLGYTISFLTQEQMKNIGLHVYPMKDTDGSPVMRSTYFLYQDQEEQPEYIRAFIKMILEQSNTLL